MCCSLVCGSAPAPCAWVGHDGMRLLDECCLLWLFADAVDVGLRVG